MKIVLPLFLLEGISAGELIIIFLIVLLFFGSKSIPKIARTFGRGMRQIRDASHQIQEDIKNAVVDDIPRSNLKKEESSLIGKINDLDHKNTLLSTNLDLDYVEVLIRERFLFGKKDETIYIIKKNDN